MVVELLLEFRVGVLVVLDLAVPVLTNPGVLALALVQVLKVATQVVQIHFVLVELRQGLLVRSVVLRLVL